jgi:hypothetical protein
MFDEEVYCIEAFHVTLEDLISFHRAAPQQLCVPFTLLDAQTAVWKRPPLSVNYSGKATLKVKQPG